MSIGRQSLGKPKTGAGVSAVISVVIANIFFFLFIVTPDANAIFIWPAFLTLTIVLALVVMKMVKQPGRAVLLLSGFFALAVFLLGLPGFTHYVQDQKTSRANAAEFQRDKVLAT